jgi:hypothetical protein
MKGIVMSAESVRAILDGRKTQTRRVVKWIDHANPNLRGMYQRTSGGLWSEVYGPPGDPNKGMIVMSKRRCPYGKPGDVLYVKEPFALLNDIQSGTATLYRDCDGQGIPIAYREAHEGSVKVSRWRSPIFMPRAAARLKIVLTEVRVERLQDISEEDALAEGVEPLFSHAEIHEPRYRSEFDLSPMPFKNYLWHGHFGRNGMGNSKSDAWEYQYSSYKDAKGSYSSLWEKINGPGSWESNPFVWVLSFKRYEEEEG